MIKTIHKGRYTAEFFHAHDDTPTLVITRPRGGGVMVGGEQAITWRDAIKTAINKSEANALCRALLNQ